MKASHTGGALPIKESMSKWRLLAAAIGFLFVGQVIRFQWEEVSVLSTIVGGKLDSIDKGWACNVSPSQEIPEAKLLRAAWENLESRAYPSSPTILVDFKARRRQLDPRNSIVVATHGSVGRLQNVLTHLRYWNGPASVAIYVTKRQELDTLIEFVTTKEVELQDTALHLLIEYSPSNPTVYPHNLLRNVALDHVGSDYFVAMDVDLMPSKDCYSELKQLLTSKSSGLRRELDNFRIMVLPAFEVFSRKGESVATEDQLPSSKAELKRLVDQKQAEAFHWKIFKEGQAATDYPKWFQQLEGEMPFYSIEYQPKYEPYVMGYRPGIPRYRGEFRGFGKDKISWIEELDRANYTFGVMMNQYVVHLQHPSNENREQFKLNSKRYRVFADYLDRKYGKRGKTN